MIEILLKNKEIVRVQSCKELSDSQLDFTVMQLIDSSNEDKNWLKERFDLDFSKASFELKENKTISVKVIYM